MKKYFWKLHTIFAFVLLMHTAHHCQGSSYTQKDSFYTLYYEDAAHDLPKTLIHVHGTCTPNHLQATLSISKILLFKRIKKDNQAQAASEPFNKADDDDTTIQTFFKNDKESLFKKDQWTNPYVYTPEGRCLFKKLPARSVTPIMLKRLIPTLHNKNGASVASISSEQSFASFIRLKNSPTDSEVTSLNFKSPTSLLGALRPIEEDKEQEYDHKTTLFTPHTATTNTPTTHTASTNTPTTNTLTHTPQPSPFFEPQNKINKVNKVNKKIKKTNNIPPAPLLAHPDQDPHIIPLILFCGSTWIAYGIPQYNAYRKHRKKKRT